MEEKTKMKNLLKQAFAICLAILMVGSVIAASASLDTYPENLQEKVTVVVGKDAQGSDYLAGTSIQKSLTSGTPVGQTNLKGVLADVEIGTKLSDANNIDTRLTDSDVEGLIDGYASFDGEKIDVSEAVFLGGNGKDITIASSLTGDEDYNEDIVLEVDKGAIRYFYNFDDSIDLREVSEDKELDITILGQDITITKVNSATSFTAIVGETKTLSPGESFTAKDHVIKLENVGDNGDILLNIDGKTKTIGRGSVYTVNSIEVYNKDTFYETDFTRRQAVIVYGEEAIQTYTDGDAFIGEDEDNPDWVWNIGNLLTKASSSPTLTNDGTGPFIGVENDFIKDDEKDNPIVLGGYIVLPNDYLRIGIESLTVNDEELQTYTFEFDSSEDLSDALDNSALSSQDVVKITTDVDEGLVVRGDDLVGAVVSTIKTDEIVLYPVSGTQLAVIYKESDSNKLKLAGYVQNLGSYVTVANIDYEQVRGDDLVIKANFNPALDKLDVSVEPKDVTNDVTVMSFGLSSTNVLTGLGTEKGKEEAGELTHNLQTIGSKDNDLRTKFGILIRDPESNGADDRVRLDVPSDKVEAGIEVSRNTGEGSTVSKDAKLTFFGEDDSEAELEGDLILVGGPAVNPLTAKYLGVDFPSYGTTEAFPYESGEGIIKIVEADGKKVIIVAGYNAEDTTALAEKLASNEGITGELITL